MITSLIDNLGAGINRRLRDRAYPGDLGHRDRITRTVGPPPAEFWVPPVYPMIPGLSEIRTGNLVGNPKFRIHT